MWCNNTFSVDVVCFNANKISDFLGWKMNICIKKFSHPYVYVICYCHFSICDSMFPNSIGVYYHCGSNTQFFFELN